MTHTPTAAGDTTSPPNDDEETPRIIIHGAHRYLTGLPMLIALTYENHSKDSDFFNLSAFDPTTTRGNLRVLMDPIEGGKGLESGFAPPNEPKGISLFTGQSSRQLVDLSNIGVAYAPGAYRLTAVARFGRRTRSSNTIELEIAQPPESDVAEITALRRMGQAPRDTGAWAPFLTRNSQTVTISGALSAASRELLLLHLFLHRAAYGQTPLSALAPEALNAVKEPTLQAECAALRYELLASRHDPSTQTNRSAMLSQYPGLAHRAESVDRGEGQLTEWRKAFGAERKHFKPITHQPDQY